ncbi:nucleotide exchange factor GrpE [Methyloraptor flagellatus]|jgi:molecular chaperone GrpE|uniref:Protein GrpE n=1 Tax=Methyloraptor flagellatus TaxID=3162530 RepID=A0AAU7X912_9HYPH
MTDETKHGPAGAESGAETADAATTIGAEAPANEAAAGAGTPDPIAAAQALASENAELKDRVLRTLAEMENLRRRTEKEVKDARDYAVTAFARDLLSVSDNFSRALGALPAELRTSADAGIKALVDGVEMTGRELLKSLERHGVKKLEPLGQKFDPNMHQAMFEIPNADVVSGTVVQVLQDGYAIGERVLRPALVGVAKGGPKQAPAEAAQPEPGAGVDRTV